MRIEIITGGQTGVDRAALDAALSHQIPCGGWCPAGRKAEDGAIPARYPLTELPGADYSQRTRRNVMDSDGTAVIYFSELSGGSALTLDECQLHDKPFVIFDGSLLDVLAAASMLRRFVNRHRIVRMNVAGPRASEAPQAYAYTFNVIDALLSDR